MAGDWATAFSSFSGAAGLRALRRARRKGRAGAHLFIGSTPDDKCKRARNIPHTFSGQVRLVSRRAFKVGSRCVYVKLHSVGCQVGSAEPPAAEPRSRDSIMGCWRKDTLARRSNAQELDEGRVQSRASAHAKGYHEKKSQNYAGGRLQQRKRARAV